MSGLEGLPPDILDAWRREQLQGDKNDAPDLLSAAQLGEVWGIHSSNARIRADRLVTAGRAEQRIIRRGRHIVTVYRLLTDGKSAAATRHTEKRGRSKP